MLSLTHTHPVTFADHLQTVGQRLEAFQRLRQRRLDAERLQGGKGSAEVERVVLSDQR